MNKSRFKKALLIASFILSNSQNLLGMEEIPEVTDEVRHMFPPVPDSELVLYQRDKLIGTNPPQPSDSERDLQELDGNNNQFLDVNSDGEYECSKSSTASGSYESVEEDEPLPQTPSSQNNLGQTQLIQTSPKTKQKLDATDYNEKLEQHSQESLQRREQEIKQTIKNLKNAIATQLNHFNDEIFDKCNKKNRKKNYQILCDKLNIFLQNNNPSAEHIKQAQDDLPQLTNTWNKIQFGTKGSLSLSTETVKQADDLIEEINTDIEEKEKKENELAQLKKQLEQAQLEIQRQYILHQNNTDLANELSRVKVEKEQLSIHIQEQINQHQKEIATQSEKSKNTISEVIQQLNHKKQQLKTEKEELTRKLQLKDGIIADMQVDIQNAHNANQRLNNQVQQLQQNDNPKQSLLSDSSEESSDDDSILVKCTNNKKLRTQYLELVKNLSGKQHNIQSDFDQVNNLLKQKKLAPNNWDFIQRIINKAQKTLKNLKSKSSSSSSDSTSDSTSNNTTSSSSDSSSNSKSSSKSSSSSSDSTSDSTTSSDLSDSSSSSKSSSKSSSSSSDSTSDNTTSSDLSDSSSSSKSSSKSSSSSSSSESDSDSLSESSDSSSSSESDSDDSSSDGFWNTNKKITNPDDATIREHMLGILKHMNNPVAISTLLAPYCALELQEKIKNAPYGCKKIRKHIARSIRDALIANILVNIPRYYQENPTEHNGWLYMASYLGTDAAAFASERQVKKQKPDLHKKYAEQVKMFGQKQKLAFKVAKMLAKAVVAQVVTSGIEKTGNYFNG